MKVYLVGGAVRDLVLGNRPKDCDYVVTGATYDDMVRLGFKPILAQSFPVFHHPITGDEWALARKERKTGPGYHGFETIYDPTITIEDDLYRRDLTINSMAYEIPINKPLNMVTGLFPYFGEELIIDPYNGLQDLENKVLRHTSKAFSEDPVRVLRTARFAARYGFDIHKNTVKLMQQMVTDGELEHLTTERVWLEITKAMSELYPSKFFQTLYDLKLNHVVHNIFKDNSLLIDIGPNLTLVQRCMLFAFLLEFDLNTLVSAFNNLKAPNDVIVGVHRFGQIVNELDTWRNSAHQIYDIIEMYDGFKNPDYIHNFGRVLDAILEHMLSFQPQTDTTIVAECKMRLMTVHEMCLKTGKINFTCLTKEQQQTLRGPDIGTAIKTIRIQLIESYINN